jgi:hypothetical protein
LRTSRVQPRAEEPSLVCVPGAIPAVERAAHFALARELFTKRAKERLDFPNGLAFGFDGEIIDALARFIVNERRCCPFVDFTITVAHEGGPTWLRMTGPEGTRELLQSEFEIERGCGCKDVCA